MRKIVLALPVAFSMVLTVAYIANSFAGGLSCITLALKDSAESHEDHKPVQNLQDVKMEQLARVNLERRFFHRSSTYLHRGQAIVPEVFLEVVTPPPEFG